MFHPARKAAQRTTRLTRAVIAAAVALSGSALIGLATVPASGADRSAASLDPRQFNGVNWADPRDNYANDPVVLSGLSLSDDYATTYAKASGIIAGFRKNLQANTVRLPINPYTVNGSYWSSYRAVTDAATAQGFKVILSYWEGTGDQKDGFIDNLPDFWRMWGTVTHAYQRNPLVYFEPMNEPHGYTAQAWADVVAQWISTYPYIPRNRIFTSGSGYNDSVTSVCADHRLDGTYLSLHHYGFWKQSATYSEWVNDLKARLGSCASRTVADEFGAPMTTGLNYNQPASASTDPNSVAFIQADTDVFRELHMGSVYWPGLRTGDIYSIQTLTGSGTHLGLATTNQSGADRLAWAWGKGHPATEQ